MSVVIYKRIGRKVWHASILFLVMAALYIGLGRFLVTNLSDYSDDILKLLNARLPFAVSARQISGIWKGFGPKVVLTDAIIRLENETFSPLVVGELSLHLKPILSFLARSPKFAEVKVQNASLQLSLSANGLPSSQYLSSDLKGIRHILSEFSSDADLISLVDNTFEVRAADGETYSFLLNVEGTRRGNYQTLQTLIALEDDSLLQLSTHGKGDLFEPDNYFGELYLSINLQRHGSTIDLLSKLSLHPFFGGAQLQAWIEISPDLLTGVGEIEAQDLIISYPDSGLTIPSDSASAFIGIEHVDNEWSISATDLFVTFEEESLEINRSHFLYSENEILAVAPSMAIENLVNVLEVNPYIPEKLRQVLSDSKPSGNLENLIIQIDRSVDNEWFWRSQMEFEGLAVRSWKESPAIANASGWLRISPEIISIMMDSEDLSIWFPKIFESPLKYDSLLASAYITWGNDKVFVSSDEFAAIGREGSFVGDFDLELVDVNGILETVLELEIGVRDANMNHLEKYLPINLPDHTKNWLLGSIQRADVHDLGFVFRGNLKREMRELRTMQLFAKFSKADVKFHADWPKTKDLSGLLILNDQDISVWVEEGSFGDVDLSFLSAELFSDIEAGFQVEVGASSESDIESVFSLIHQSPLVSEGLDFISDWNLSGRANLFLDFEMDISEGLDSSNFELDASFNQVAVEIGRANLDITNISGGLKYTTEAGFSSYDLAGSIWGKALKIEAKSIPILKNKIFASSESKETNIFQRGHVATFSTEVDLSKIKEWLQLENLAFVHGMTSLDLVLNALPGKVPTFHFSSQLEGVGIDLPPPWGKSSNQQLGFRGLWTPREAYQLVSIWFASGINIEIALSDGDIEGGKLSFLNPDLDLGSWFESAWLELEEIEAFKDKGKFTLSGFIESFNAEEWSSFFHKYYPERFGKTFYSKTTAPLNEAFPLDFVVENLSVSEFLFSGVLINSLKFDYWFDDSKHFLRNKSDWMKGLISIEQNAINIDLENIELSSLSNINIAQHASDIRRNFPRAEISVADISYNSSTLGNLSFILESKDRETLISNIRGRVAGFEFPTEESPILLSSFSSQTLTNFNGTLLISDLGKTLEQFGYERILRTESGTASFDLSWTGGIADFSIRELKGNINLNLYGGSFLEAPAGTSSALRVASIFDLADMLDQLSLSHVFDSGIPFNKLDCEIDTNNGKIRIPSFDMTGSGSNFNYIGEVNLSSMEDSLGRSELNGELVVTLPVADNLPWIAALAAGSAFIPVAAGVYVASKIFEEDVDRLSSGVYSVSGTLDDPLLTLEKVFDNNPISSDSNASKAPSIQNVP